MAIGRRITGRIEGGEGRMKSGGGLEGQEGVREEGREGRMLSGILGNGEDVNVRWVCKSCYHHNQLAASQGLN